MSSVVVSFDSGTFLESDSGGFGVIAPQGEANIIKVKGDLPVSITGGSLADEITLGAGDATVSSQGGDDMVKGSIGNDTILGGEGKDTLIGGAGADFILGGDGDDVIKSGFVDADADENSLGDILQGGAGEDLFEFVAKEFESGPMDQILDFQDGGDVINIVGVNDGVEYDSETGILSINGNEAIDIGKGKDVTLENQGSGEWDVF